MGSTLLYELLERDGISLKNKHADCGLLIYDKGKPGRPRRRLGLRMLGVGALFLYHEPSQAGGLNNILFVATGALMSPTSSQQGESIPGVAHLVQLKKPAQARAERRLSSARGF